MAAARSCDLIVFPGHHEYVTGGEYQAVTAFRDGGGNLAFLSANNFFWRIELKGDVMTRTKQWRDLRRPEAALIGVQYLANDRGRRQGPGASCDGRDGLAVPRVSGWVPAARSRRVAWRSTTRLRPHLREPRSWPRSRMPWAAD